VKQCATAKFDETVEIAVRLGVNPKHADQMVRGALVLPHGTGQKVRVLVFAKGEKEREAREAGADFVGADELVAKVAEGNFLDFERVIATPDMMGQVGRLGKVLGPRGLMPNPKVGTVTFDVSRGARGEGRQDRVPHREGRRRAGPHRQGVVRRRAHPRERQGLVQALIRAKPTTAKGTYLKLHHALVDDGPGRANRPERLPREGDEA
jgi:large subunit ribosomal protein L1